jgi:signal transduction histidine kinase
VFANLIGNALDATPEGGRLRIRIRRAHSWGSPRTDGLRVIVADTGHGIPVELRKRIFEPFFSTKDDTGTGLGLWVTETILQKHLGRIAVRSRTGSADCGTVFSLFFPFAGISSEADHKK